MEVFFILFLVAVGTSCLIVASKKSKSQKATVQSSSPKSTSFSSLSPNKTNQRNNELTDFDIYDYGDELRISINYGRSDRENSKNKEPGRWILPNTTVKAGGLPIAKGFIYYGGQLKAKNEASSYFDTGCEAALIDPSLKVKPAKETYTDTSLGYWPKYINLSPKCRGAYISWLSSDRTNPDIPIGYVFLYFYGLERRILIDAQDKTVDDHEFKSIYEEVVRLRAIYSGNNSFDNYSVRLIQVMGIMRPAVVSITDDELANGQYQNLFLKRLGDVVGSGEPVPDKLALVWIKYYPEYRFKTPAKRCNKQFETLFCHLYADQYGEGIVVKPNKTKLKIDYHPASSTLSGAEFTFDDLPNPFMLKGPTNKLIALADECTRALEPLSRYLAKETNSLRDLEAELLLPEALTSTSETGAVSRLKAFCEASLASDNGPIVTVAELYAACGLAVPEKLLKKDLDLIIKLAERANFGIAPDYRYHNSKPAADGVIALFESGHGSHFKVTPEFTEVALTLRLGVLIASADNGVDDDETSTLMKLIDHNENLSPVSKCSLTAYLQWLIHSDLSSMAGLAVKLKSASDDKKTMIGQFLIKVALADGRIDPNEVKQLEKLYKSLGLNKDQVATDIHTITARRSSVSAPQENKAGNNVSSSGFVLNEAELKRQEQETQDVQKILSSIFQDDTEEVVEAETVSGVEGLDALHSRLFRQLIAQESWPRATVEAMCKDLGLMLEGAVETINDWAFDQADAPLIEDDGDIIMDREIVEELGVS